MAFNILDSVRSYLTPDFIDRAASHLGENSSGISRAVSGAVPVLLGGLINKAETGDANALLNDAKSAAGSNVLSNIGNLFSGGSSLLGSSSSWLGNLLGNRLGTITSALANFAGIRSGSVGSLMGLLAPIALSVLGRHATENNLSANGFRSLLTDQRSSIMNAIPTGLNLGNIFGTAPAQGVRTTTDVEYPRGREGGSRLWPILLALAALAALLYFLSRGCNRKATVATTTTDTTRIVTPSITVTDTTKSVVKEVRESLKVRLADNTEIDAYKGGIEDKLVNCLNDAGCKAGKEQWFDFDNINFEMNSAKLTAESQKQVQNIVAILKAYPKAKIKIGGYTDKTGDAATNKKLSQDRADAVLSAIKSAGANAAQLAGAEGYGSEQAKIPATASDEERRVDRRISVQLREK